SEEERERRALLELYERLAAAFTYLLVEHPSGEGARAVLRRRAVPDGLRDEFRLGYAPRDRRWLHGFLQKKGYSGDFLRRSGLFAEKHPDFPLFADRLMFPIAQARGEVVGFGGRLLEGEGPKYINSPDTALFHKQENLFALDKALPAIKKEGVALICEGYMDAISFHAAGLRNAVAPLGTAFTEKQARLLKRWAQTLLLAFDADPAGQRAAEKSVVLAAAAGLEARVVVLPGGKDASEILEKEGPESLQKVRDLTINGGEFLVRRARELFDIASVEGKARAAAFLNPYLDALDSEVKRDAFFDLASRELRADPRSLRSDYEDQKKGIQPRRNAAAAPDGVSGPAPAARTPDLLFMAAIAANEGLFAKVRSLLSLEDLDDPRARDLYIALEESFRAEERGIEAALGRVSDESLRTFVLERAASGEFSENAERFVEDGILRIRRRSLERRRGKVLERMADFRETDPSREAEGPSLNDLLYEKMYLDAELAKMKGERDERS
ncbi:MAG: toprim domain-containing protein, partial [Spirochaetaceae bacterium]|nr:toprim domain-containing protein [Spirochaetaceae bacterium]